MPDHFQAPAPGHQDTFRGDDAALVASIRALLDLDAAGVLVPHGIGGHARGLLASAAARLGSHQPAATWRATAGAQASPEAAA